MGQVLHRGLLQGREPVEVSGLWGQRLVSTISWRRLGGLPKVTEGGLVRRSWVDGSEETMWKPSLRIRLRRCRPLPLAALTVFYCRRRTQCFCSKASLLYVYFFRFISTSYDADLWIRQHQLSVLGKCRSVLPSIFVLSVLLLNKSTACSTFV